MANFVQIPNLPAVTVVGGDEQLETVQAGVSRRLTTAQVRDYVVESYPTLSDRINLVAVTDARTLGESESGSWFTNRDASNTIILTLPETAASGTNYTALVLSGPGISFLPYPNSGTFISMNGEQGVLLTSQAPGARCWLVRTSSVEWVVVDTFPENSWILVPPSENDFDPDLLAWREAVRAQGGEPLLETMIAYDQFMAAEKAAGLWDKTADYALTWKQALEDDAVAMVTLKQHHIIVQYNGTTPDSSLGYTTDGESQWLDLNFVPSIDHAGIMTGTDQRLAFYSTKDVDNNAVAVGVRDGSPLVIAGRPRAGANMRAAFGGAIVNFALPVATSLGFTAMSRTPTTISAWRDGVPLGTTAATMSDGLPAYSFYIGAQNNRGVPELYVSSQIPFVAIGRALTDAEEVIARTNVLILATYHDAIITPDTEDDGP